MTLQDVCSSPHTSAFSFLLSCAQRMEILKTDFGIKTKEIEEMFTYDDYRYGESRREGFREGLREGRNKVLIHIFINMKRKNINDEDIRSCLGISLYKLRQIKKMAKESSFSQNHTT